MADLGGGTRAATPLHPLFFLKIEKHAKNREIFESAWVPPLPLSLDPPLVWSNEWSLQVA